MTDTARLRAAVSGLVAFTAEEETVLLAVAAPAQVYQRYARQPAGAVAAASRRVTAELIG
jgi:thiamine monophosphate kinase